MSSAQRCVLIVVLKQLLLALLKTVTTANGIYLISVLTQQRNPVRAASAEHEPAWINQSAAFLAFLRSAEVFARLLYEKKLVFTGCTRSLQLLLRLN